MARIAAGRERRPQVPLAEPRALEALARLYRARALHTLLRGVLPPSLLRRLLKPVFGARSSLQIPDDAWASLAAKYALETIAVGVPVAEALADRLGWDRPPAGPAEWARLTEDKPLEALWLAASSEDKTIRKGFPRLAAAAIKAFRASPACPAPSWDFLDMLLELQASQVGEIDDLGRQVEDLERRVEAERHRSEDLRDELKRLRRESTELRTERAAAERRAAAAAEAQALAALAPESGRLSELERRLRKSEKEAEHLRRELARGTAIVDEEAAGTAPAGLPVTIGALTPADAASPSIADDPNPRRRVLRQILRRLFKKGKIGASHTHEDNVYRSVPDHEKGIAKEAMDLLYREGLLMPKPTATDPHVSLRPDRAAEVQAIVAGELANPRLARFVNERG